MTSLALEGNLLGDPTTRGYYIYLPPGYESSDKRYPVVYVLHGYTPDIWSWIATWQNVANAMIASDKVGEMILVFPDASNKLGGSWYLSSPTIGDYETYLTQELVAHIDANYRTIPQRESRGTTGCSMGADGAVHLGLSYPEVFSVVAGMSGTYDVEHDPAWDSARRGFRGAPEDLSAFSKLPLWVRWWMAGAAAAASNPDKPPFYLDMPFEMVDDEAQIVAEVAERVNATDCVHDVDEYLQQPTRLNGLMIYHGESDPFVDTELVRGFDALLTEQGIEHEYLEVPGGHCDFRYAPVVQFMSDHLAFEMAE